MDNQIRSSIRERIKALDIKGLQDIYYTLVEENREYRLPLEDIYQKAFFSACNNNFKEAIIWLFELYESMDPIRKTALRQMFFYGKTLIHDSNKNWYEISVLSKARLY